MRAVVAPAQGAPAKMASSSSDVRSPAVAREASVLSAGVVGFVVLFAVDRTRRTAAPPTTNLHHPHHRRQPPNPPTNATNHTKRTNDRRRHHHRR